MIPLSEIFWESERVTEAEQKKLLGKEYDPRLGRAAALALTMHNRYGGAFPLAARVVADFVIQNRDNYLAGSGYISALMHAGLLERVSEPDVENKLPAMYRVTRGV